MSRTDRLPPLGPLRTFLCVARHGTIARAARELNLSASAISQAIKKLEGWFGLPLMVREPQGIVLLPDGERLRAACDDAFDLLSSTSSEILGHADRSPVVLNAPPSLMSCRLQGVLGPLLERYPDLSLELISRPGPLDFRYDSVDLALRHAPNGAGRYHDATLLVADRIQPLVSPFVLEGLDRTKVDLPATHRLIHHDPPGGEARGHWDRWLSIHGVEASGDDRLPALRVDDFSVAAELAAGGHGIVMGQSLLADRWLASGELVPLFPDLAALDLDGGWYLLQRPEAQLGGPARRVRDYFLSSLGEEGRTTSRHDPVSVSRLSLDDSVRTTSTPPVPPPVWASLEQRRRVGRGR